MPFDHPLGPDKEESARMAAWDIIRFYTTSDRPFSKCCDEEQEAIIATFADILSLNPPHFPAQNLIEGVPCLKGFIQGGFIFLDHTF